MSSKKPVKNCTDKVELDLSAFSVVDLLHSIALQQTLDTLLQKTRSGLDEMFELLYKVYCK